MKRFLLLGIVCILFIPLLDGCNLIPREKYKPIIKAMPSATDAGIKWGREKAKITANIDDVVIECIPVERPTDLSKSKTNVDNEYEIAATANISYIIFDKSFYRQITIYSDIEAKVIFEALSTSGVVLGQAEGTVRIIENGSSAKASAKIYGLTLDEIKKVGKVEARWKYGR